MGNFSELKVWQKSHRLVLAIYEATASFPKDEQFGLTSQLRRSATSVASNIAEGNGRGGDRELVRFLKIALGSAEEAEYQLLLARDLTLLQEDKHKELKEACLEVQRMLASLVSKLDRPTKNDGLREDQSQYDS